MVGQPAGQPGSGRAPAQPPAGHPGPTAPGVWQPAAQLHAFGPPHHVYRRGPLRPLGGRTQRPRPPEQRPLSRGDRNAVAFVLHQFPIGHMPVAASEPSRQLPPPPADHDQPGGLRVPPQDHPRSALVDSADALERIRSGEAHTGRARARVLPSAEHQRLPEELRADHDPLGGLTEQDWVARFVVRVGSRDEHAWPPGEGGSEAQPVVLAPDTDLDCLGTGEGRLLAAGSAPFAQRSLPAEHLERDYRRYRVLRPLPAWKSVSGPWFGQPGGAARYRTTYPLAELVALGYLVELGRDRQLAETGTTRMRTGQLGAGQLGDGWPGGGQADSGRSLP